MYNPQAFLRGFLKAASNDKVAAFNYPAVIGGLGAGIGAVGGAALGGKKHRARNALLGALTGGGLSFAGAKGFQHVYNAETERYLTSNLKQNVAPGSNQWVLDSFRPEGYQKDSVPAFLKKYPNNSLLIDAHGGARLGQYSYKPENHLTDGATKLLPRDWMKNRFTLEDLAKQMGPEAASKIEYLGDMACKNPKHAPTPQDAQKVFKGLKEVVMLPRGSINWGTSEQELAKVPVSPYVSQNPEIFENLLSESDDGKTDLHGLLGKMNKNMSVDSSARPMRYTNVGGEWVNNGAFNLKGEQSPVTTPYIFDEPGVRQKLIQTWPSIRGTSQYEHLMELERRSPAEHTTAVSTGRSLLSQLQNNKLSAGQQSELLAQLRQLRAQYY